MKLMENFNDRTRLAIELAKIAGSEIKRILHDEDIHTKGKGLNDVVTIADIKSEKLIADKITEVFAEDTIYRVFEKQKARRWSSIYS